MEDVLTSYGLCVVPSKALIFTADVIDKFDNSIWQAIVCHKRNSTIEIFICVHKSSNRLELFIVH